MCTLKAQDDLRFEENIDAFSLSGGVPGALASGKESTEGRLANICQSVFDYITICDY